MKWTRRFILLVVQLLLLSLAFGAGFLARDWVAPAGVAGPVTLGWLGGSAAEQALPAADLGPYWQVWRLLERDFYGPHPDLTTRTYSSIRGLVAAYGDPHTYFVEPQPHELQRDALRGSFGGIGAWIDRDEVGFVLRPMPDQAAALAGIRAGDRLLRVEELAVTLEMSGEQVALLIRGPVGSQVCVTLGRDGEELRLCIERAEIRLPSVEWRMLDDDPATANIGYIRHTTFSERSSQEMRTALHELIAAGADRFILDLRGNPGGLLNAAVDVADLWLDGGVVLYERHADGREREFTVEPGELAAGAPLAVIVDGGSASASEILAGALQDRRRGLLVGQRTYGKGSVQLVHELVDASSLHVTTARWYTPNHYGIDGAGLTPDLPIGEGEDPLPRAIAAVQEMVGGSLVRSQAR